MKRLLVLLMIVFLLVGCSSDPERPPIKIVAYDKVNETYFNHYVEAEITAIVDQVTIKSVVINRGNCEIYRAYGNNISNLPATLNFGETITVISYGPCKAVQIDVATDQGEWTVTYE